jgi:hypothetical protein
MAAAQTPVKLTEEKLHGRDAWVLDNGLMRFAVLRGGGHFGEIRLVSKDPKAAINPMRVPHYPTIDPHTFDPARHESIYGNQTHKWLSSGYMGHLLCFPNYGPPSSEDEIRAGQGNHGEAPIVEWRKVRADVAPDKAVFVYGADLPKTQYRVERTITMKRGERQVRVEESVENLALYDRPYQWMQHATFGPPFVEPGKTFLDVSATRGLVGGARPGGGSLKDHSPVTWPRGTAHHGTPVDLRGFQPREHAGTYYALELDPARSEEFFTMYHSGYHVLIGYVFPREGFPWLADWQENKGNSILPWNNKVVARGLEFGNSPFAEGLRKAVERGSLFDLPAYGWIGARARHKVEYAIFVREIPAGFRGVKDARLVNGVATVTNRD